jgi:hypothetical protein
MAEWRVAETVSMNPNISGIDAPLDELPATQIRVRNNTCVRT